MSQATICFFYTRLCSCSKTLLPEWQKFRFQCEGKKINGYTLKFASYDFTPIVDSQLWNKTHLQTNEPVVKYWVEQCHIHNFPTVRLIKDLNEVNYTLKTKMTAKTLKRFVDEELTRITYK